MSADQASKLQERETLEQIMALIQKIGGDDSYIGLAMKGVYEVAISNIENDFGDSMAERAEMAITRAEKYAKEADTYKAEAEETRQTAETYKRLHNEAVDIVSTIQDELDRERTDHTARIEAEQAAKRRAEGTAIDLFLAKREIIELKAKLYDLMTK